jgi:hypothetical protein
MSQTGYSKVQIYSSSTASNTPSASNLTNDTNGSELAINITDGKLFYKNNSGSIQLLANSSSQVPTPFTANGIVYASSTSALSTGSALTFDGTNLSNTGRFIVNNAGSAAGTTDISFGAYSGGAWINTPSATTAYLAAGGSGSYAWSTTQHIWSISGSEQMRLTSTGLGIGNSSPYTWSTGKAITLGSNAVLASDSTYGGAVIASNVYYNGGWKIASTGSINGGLLTVGNYGRMYFYGTSSGTAGNASTLTQYLHIDGNNSGALTVGPTSGAVQDAIINISNTNYYSNLNFQNSGTTYAYVQGYYGQGLVFGVNSTYNYVWLIGGSEKMRLNSSGYLGIGTSSPSALLNLSGVAATGIQSLLSNGTTTAYNYFTLSNTSGNMRIGIEGSSGGVIMSGSSAYSSTISSVGNTNLHLGTNATANLTIDTSGNLGLGVTPSAWNSIFKAIDVGTTASFVGSSGGADVFNNAYYNGSNYIYKTSDNATRYLQTSGGHYWYNAPSGTAGNPISGANAFVQAMTLDNSGNLFVGTTSSFTARLSVQTANNNGTDYAYYAKNSSGTVLGYQRDDGLFNTGSATNSPYNFTTASAANLFTDSSGTIYRSTSSLKYKTNVQDAVHGLSDLLKLRAVTYQGKSEADTGKTFGGLIAEEVHTAGLTEFVQYANDGTPDALAYGNMVSLCIKSIQELSAQVTTLQSQVAALTPKS